MVPSPVGGITEIADIFAVNKSDMASALKMATELKRHDVNILAQADNEPVAVLNHNRPTAGFRLNHRVGGSLVFVTLIALGKRDKNLVCATASTRLSLAVFTHESCGLSQA